MKRALQLWAFAYFCFILTCEAEIIDRIVAIVDGHIITLSDVRQEREIRTRLGQKTAESDKTLIEALIDNRLIESEIKDYPGIGVNDSEVDAFLKDSVAGEGPPTQAVREAVRRRMTMQKLFDIKFGQGIQPTDADIRKYYDEVFVPEARRRGDQIDPLSEPQMYRAIRGNVVQEAMNHEINLWLEAIRKRSIIEVFE